ncbi:MAG: DUF4080 domain-containing protein [Candidatus Cloacimonetes bacterium]|nr:DUF4080 domain-containing protein [Candidatus Cloacimonadota bacterium]
MIKLVLAGINARFTHSNLALYYLRNYIKDLQYEVYLLEFSINQYYLDILRYLYEKKPDIIAFSVYIWNSAIIRSLIPEIKKILPDCKIILGGPEVSYNAPNWLRRLPEIDFIVCGAGETGFYHVLEHELRLSDRIISIRNPSLSDIPFPYSERDFPDLNKKYIYYESSRGCPFKCSYCLSSRNDQVLEFRDIELVKKELRYLIEKKPKIIKFVDRTFNADREHARNIWRFLIATKPETKFHFEIFPALLEEKDFQILSRCPEDLFQFEIGIQSTNPATLKAINRYDEWKSTGEKIERLLSLRNIHIHVDLIAGLPFENMSSLQKSFDKIYSLRADHFQLGFLKILPGTEMDTKRDEFEIKCLEEAPYRILENKWLSYSEFILIRKIENLLNIFYNSQKFKTTIENLVKKYDSPFKFFSDLKDFCEKMNYEIETKNWHSNSSLLFEFIEKQFPEMRSFFFDCLRWDWCYITNSHFFPELLRTNENKKAKKIGFRYLKQLAEKGNIKYKNWNFTVSDLKKAVFFIPVSNKFKQEYMNVNSIAVFLTINNRKTYLMLKL